MDRCETVEPNARAEPSPMTVALAGFAALAIAMGIGRFAFTPILPLMREDAALSVAAGGWLAAANYLGYLLGALAALRWRVRPSVALRSGLVAIALATLAMGVEQRFAGWIALRFAAGVASAWVLIFVSASTLARLAASGRPRLSAVVFAGVGGGIALAGFACLGLSGAHAGSATAWIVLGAAALVATAVVWPVFGANGEARRASATAPQFRWNADAAKLVACYGAFGFGYIVPATFLPAMARAQIADPGVFGWVWPVFGTAAAASTFVAAVWLKRANARRPWALCHVAMAFGVLLPLASGGLVGLTFSALLVGGTFMVITMLAMREAQHLAGPAGAALMAAMTSAFAAGQMAGPILFSLVSSGDDDFSFTLAVAAAVLLAAAAALILPSKERPK
jgi:predicted MFS family arabinose efflux permease